MDMMAACVKISGGQSVNPLYELSMSTDTGTSNSQSVNPLYDFDQSGFSLSTKTQSPSANPLYDFMSGADTNGHSGDLIDTGVTMETTNAIDDDSLLSSIDAKLKEKSDVEDQAKENVDLLNGEGDTNNTGDLLNGHVEQADQNIVSLEAEKPKEEEDVTIEQLEKEGNEEILREKEKEYEVVDSGSQLIETGDSNNQLIDTNEQSNDTGDQFGDQLVDTGDKLEDTGDQVVDTGDKIVETDDQKVEEPQESLLDIEDKPSDETRLSESRSESDIIADDNDLVEKNISEDFDPSIMDGEPPKQIVTEDEQQKDLELEAADDNLVQVDEPVAMEEPVMIQAEEAPVPQEESAPVQEEPILAPDEPAPALDEPVPAQEEPISTQEESVPAQEEPVPAQEEPVPAQEEEVHQEELEEEECKMSVNGDSMLENGDEEMEDGNTYSMEVGVARLDEESFKEHMKCVNVIESPDLTRKSVLQAEFGVSDDDADVCENSASRNMEVSDDTGVFSDNLHGTDVDFIVDGTRMELPVDNYDVTGNSVAIESNSELGSPESVQKLLDSDELKEKDSNSDEKEMGCDDIVYEDSLQGVPSNVDIEKDIHVIEGEKDENLNTEGNEIIYKEDLDSKLDTEDIPTNMVKRLSLQFSEKFTLYELTTSKPSTTTCSTTKLEASRLLRTYVSLRPLGLAPPQGCGRRLHMMLEKP
ncbi:hypothetical protein FSP39_000575 [Pinctada imbricata]|uniref:Uncharacterized protein n=1 Tax=Pinctada imbricata TaxID=66713 RepID=A0AA88YKP4_PINIB|nr:hypothetical protein FSP39_000575 [Pinctada imbricata]